MKPLVLSPEQARLVAAACEPVQVADARGNHLGWLTPAPVQEPRSAPGYGDAEILAALRTMLRDEDRTGCLTPEQIQRMIDDYEARLRT